MPPVSRLLPYLGNFFTSSPQSEGQKGGKAYRFHQLFASASQRASLFAPQKAPLFSLSASCSSPHGHTTPFSSRRLQRPTTHLGDAHQVVRRKGDERLGLHPGKANEPGLCQTSNRFGPAKHLFDPSPEGEACAVSVTLRDRLGNVAPLFRRAMCGVTSLPFSTATNRAASYLRSGLCTILSVNSV